MADDLPSAQAPTTPIVPVNATLAAAAVVQRRWCSNYEPRKSVAKITKPTRPALPAPPEPPQDGSPLLLM